MRGQELAVEVQPIAPIAKENGGIAAVTGVADAPGVGRCVARTARQCTCQILRGGVDLTVRTLDTLLGKLLEFATLEWVDWFNHRRLLESIGNIPPAETEERYYAMLETPAMAA